MIDNSYYSQEVHGPYDLHVIGNLELEEGGTIRNCQLAYATFGTLNGAKDNAILVPTWYSGTNKIIEQVFVGSGHALDPDKYFIIKLITEKFGLNNLALVECCAHTSSPIRTRGKFAIPAGGGVLCGEVERPPPI